LRWSDQGRGGPALAAIGSGRTGEAGERHVAARAARGAVDGDATNLNLRLVRAACIVAMHAMMIMMMTVMVIVVAAAVGADRAARVKVREQRQIWARNDTGQRAQRHSTPAIRAAAEAAP
jgi:hypothetical protein